MPVLEVLLTIKVDGQSLPGSPVIRRVTVDETQSFATEQATGGGYASLPITNLDQVNWLLLTPDQLVTLRTNAQSDGGIIVNGGGLVLLVDTVIAAAASTNATVDNSSGSTTVLTGLAGGT